MARILEAAGAILTSVITWMTSLTDWIIGDTLAMLFLGMMLILFGVKLVLTLTKRA